MKSLKDAERVVDLCRKRNRTLQIAEKFAKADRIGASLETKRPFPHPEHEVLTFTHRLEQLRALVQEELESEIARIDSELLALGIVRNGAEVAAA